MIAFHDLDVIAGSEWSIARGYLREDLERLQAGINAFLTVAHEVDGTQIAASQGQILGQLSGTLAEAPLGLSADDNGLLYFVTDYHQLVRWDGSAAVWKFAPGHGNGYFRDFGITPQEVGWALCDGSGTTYLVVGGATLTTASFTTPNLSGLPAYKKSAAAYTGTVVAAGGSTGTGTTGTGTTGTGTTANDGGTFAPTIFNAADTAASINTTAHTHSIPGLSVPGLSVPALSIGSIDTAHLNVLPYFKR